MKNSSIGGFFLIYAENKIQEDDDLNLGNRLQCIADQIDKEARVADIGTDHAYIPVYLVKEGISQFVIASDVNKGPLEKAKKHISQNGLGDSIQTRLGGGLSVLDDAEVDEVIIAGMGGVLISQIIEDDFGKASGVNKLVLQPMQASHELRKYLFENGFEIQKECLAKEDEKMYEIIIASYAGDSDKRKDIIDGVYFEIGKRLLETDDKDLLVEFLDKKIKKYEGIISNLEGNKTIKAALRFDFCSDRLKKIREIRNNVA